MFDNINYDGLDFIARFVKLLSIEKHLCVPVVISTFGKKYQRILLKLMRTAKSIKEYSVGLKGREAQGHVLEHLRTVD